MATYSNIELLVRHDSETVNIALTGSDGKASVWTLKPDSGIVEWRTHVSIIRSEWLVLDSPYFVEKREP
ncbi:hypothetical protein LCGC14_2383450 [marine sediment metagenome]|uniref:Uncharacterized protein n=1 Tax=marine sediment metagenome TaxID=412755 RepID=A0A0F9CMD3_9ZZZZ